MTEDRDQHREDPLLEAGLSRAYSPDTLPAVPRVTESEPVYVGDGPTPDAFSTASGRFQILGEVARGGMGTVLRVLDRDLGRIVAVKVLHERLRHDENARRRFLTEAQITGQLHHPGVPPIHDLGRGPDGTPSIIMEFVQGRTLAGILQERGSPAEDQPRLLRLFADLCRIVAHAHGSSVVHRDIKPLNVMVGQYGEVFLLDWGVARILRNPETEDSPDDPSASIGATRAGTVVGTPGYMAPEQARGEISRVCPATDVFALGSMLCEILTGQPPVTGNTDDVRRRLAAGELSEGLRRLRASEADPQLLAIAERALAPAPEDRFPDAEAMHEALTSREEHLSQRAQAAESRATAERRLRRFTIAGSLAVILSAGGAFLIWDHFQEQQRQLGEEAYREALVLVKTAQASDSDLQTWELAVAGIAEAVSTYERGTAFADLGDRIADLRNTADAGHEAATEGGNGEREPAAANAV